MNAGKAAPKSDAEQQPRAPQPQPAADGGPSVSDANRIGDAKRLLASLQGVSWHQRFEIAPGVFTPGTKDVLDICQQMQLPSDLSGKTLLDVGASNGGFSFEMERRGAAVTAIDVLPEELCGLPAIAHFLGSKVKYRKLSVYDLDPHDIGAFDTVLFLGVIYHLRHPLLGLDKIWAVTNEWCYLESHVLDEGLATPWGMRSLKEFDPRLTQLPLVEFHRLDELNGDLSNWFSPTVAALEAWLWSAGFKPEFLGQFPPGKPVRCGFRAKKLPGPSEWQRIGAY